MFINVLMIIMSWVIKHIYEHDELIILPAFSAEVYC